MGSFEIASSLKNNDGISGKCFVMPNSQHLKHPNPSMGHAASQATTKGNGLQEY